MPTIDNKVNSHTSKKTSEHQTSALTKSSSSQALNKPLVGTAGGFYKGQMIKGEVIDLRDKDVKIQLENSRTIAAKLDSNVNISIGDKATFQVTDSNLNSMSLKMLSESIGSSMDYMLDKALEEANLPHTDRNIMVVRELLNNQMSINKASIAQLLRQAATFKNASISTLVIMNKYNMPLNDVTTTQFEAYRNFEHRIINQLDDLTNSFTEVFANQDNTEASVLAKELQAMLSNHLPDIPDIFSDVSGVNINPSIHDPFLTPVSNLLDTENILQLTDLLEQYGLFDHDKIKLLAGEAPVKNIADAILMAIEKRKLSDIIETVENELLSPDEDYNSTNTLPNELLIKDSLLNEEFSNEEINSHKENLLPTATVNQELLHQLPKELSKPEVFTILEHYIKEGQEQLLLSTFLSLPEREQLLQGLSSLPISNELQEMIRSGDLSAKNLLPIFNHILDSSNQKAMNELIKNPSYQAVMKELITSYVTLTPKDLTKPNAIDTYYEKLDETLKILENLLNKKEDNHFNASSGQQKNFASNIRDNIDFMKTLNQMFTYFQMPMKLSGQNIHSELYVYTNKKNLLKNKDNIRVLLHLDMTYLGPLDIHIELNGKNIHSTFYVEDADSLAIIHDNFPLLKEILSCKGYQLNPEVKKRMKEVDIVNDFISPKESGTDMKRYTFDIRA